MLLGPDECTVLSDLRTRAVAAPINVSELIDKQSDTNHIEQYLANFRQNLTVHIPHMLMVSFSIETGHPVGTCRHVVISALRPGYVVPYSTTWEICQQLGFVGSLADCLTLFIDQDADYKSMNVLQPVSTIAHTTVQ